MTARSVKVLVAAVAFVLTHAPGRAETDRSALPQAQAPDRALVEAMGNVYRLTTYTAFDWLSARYLKGTLTLEGFARNALLKQQAEEAAKRAAGIDEVINQIQVLPSNQGDDNVRIRAYAALYASGGLEQYAPGGQLTTALQNELSSSGTFGIDASDIGRGPHGIHIIVSGARVLLRGTVKTRSDRQIAEGSVRVIPGVLAVTNELRIAGQK